MKTISKKIILTVLCLLLFPFFSVPAKAEEEEGTRILTATYYVQTTMQDKTIGVPFNPSWFNHDAQYYNHDLAKLSLGLTVASFRPSREYSDPNRDPDASGRSFLSQAGFTDLQSDDYEKDPSIYTISTIIGHEKIGSGDSAFELIAVGVCGQGYLDEWESNFTIGDGEIHEGFRAAASQVYNRIFGYIASRHISGPVKIWITGFSRAAAVSNVTAAWLTESDMFSEHTVFAYTFATPRTTRNPDISCPNIYNIVGKMDPIPYIPFADWGYDRYGTTLYTPELETDSDYIEKRARANIIYKDVTGIDFWANVDMHNEVMIILDYLIKICPTAEIYKEGLQEKLIRLWDDPTPLSVMQNILDIADDPILINNQNLHEANAFLDYLSYLAMDFALRKNSFRRWNDSASAGSNMLQGHTPELYVSWVFSADSADKLYSSSDEYMYTFLPSDTEVTLWRDDKIAEIYKPGTDNNARQYLSVIGDRLVVLTPCDVQYKLVVKFPEFGVYPIYTARYHVGRQAPQKAEITVQQMDAGAELEIYPITSEAAARAEGDIPPEEEEFSSAEYLSVSDMISLEKRNVLNLSWRSIIMILIFTLIAVLAAIIFHLVWLTFRFRFIIRKRRGWIPKNTRFQSLPIMCGTAVMQIFMFSEFCAFLFPEITYDRLTFKFIIGMLTFAIAAIGYKNKKDTLHRNIMLSMLMLMAADMTMTISLTAGTLLHISAYLFLSYTYSKEEKPLRIQLYVWLTVSAGTAVLILLSSRFPLILRLLAVLYVSSALLLVSLSITLPRTCFAGSVLLLAGGFFLILNNIHGVTAAGHFLSQGTYYAALITLASTGTMIVMPRLIPENMLDEDLK